MLCFYALRIMLPCPISTITVMLNIAHVNKHLTLIYPVYYNNNIVWPKDNVHWAKSAIISINR